LTGLGLQTGMLLSIVNLWLLTENGWCHKKPNPGGWNPLAESIRQYKSANDFDLPEDQFY